MTWDEKQAMQEYLKELKENSNLRGKEYGTNALGGKRNRAGKTARDLLEGDPPEILRRDDACTCDSGSIPSLPVCKN